MFVLIAVIILGFQIYRIFIKPHRYWKNKNVKHNQPVVVFGDIYDHVMQKASMSEIVGKLYNQYENERYCGLYEFFSPILMVRDPSLIKEITITEFQSFHDHQVFSNEKIDPLWSKNLFASKGERWKSMRQVLSTAFTAAKLKAMLPLIKTCSDQLTEHIEEANEDITTFEMSDIFTRYTNDVIATCALGVTCNSLKERDNEFYLKGREATDFSGLKNLKFIGCSLSPTLMEWLNVKIITDQTGDYFRELIDKTIKYREENNVKRPDLINILLESRENESKFYFTDEDITAQALVFYTAGFGTSSTLMVFLAYELAANKDIQDKLKAEVDAVLEECKGSITYEALAGMKYLDMVIDECLRKWPVAPTNDRVCTKDYTIKAQNPNEEDLLIEKGTTIWFPSYGIQRDPKNFPNPDVFDPERFSAENVQKIPPGAALGFGRGPRICIGSKFALLETKMLFVQILSKYEIVPVEKSRIPLVLSKKHFTIYPEGGMWLGFKRR